MDEDNFFQANGTLPIGALAAFQVAGAYPDPTAIWCGVNAWGGTVGVYGESFTPGSPENPGTRTAPSLTGVCGKGDLFGIVGQGAFVGAVFSGVLPKASIFGCTADAVLVGAEIGGVAKTRPVFGLDVQASVVGAMIAGPGSAAKPPLIGMGVWAVEVGIAIAPIDPTAPTNPPFIGVDSQGELNAYQGHSVAAEAINCQSDKDRGAVFGSGAIAQMRLLPGALPTSDKLLPAGEIGDFFVASAPNPKGPVTSFTELYFCLGKLTNGRTAWAPVLMGAIKEGV